MDQKQDTNFFTWIDYTLFTSMLGISVLIGVYFGFCQKKEDSPEEYLHGGKKMKILPVAASLIASDISGITLLGVPSEVYMHGTAYAMCFISAFLSNLAVIYVYLPVFCTLRISSSFEYLKLRFSNRICKIASILYSMNTTLYLPIVMYTSVLSLGQVSKMNLNVVTVVVCLICIFYTTFGGIKAVVWADTVQMFIIVASLFVVSGLGVFVGGGFISIWETADQGGRIDFNLSFDPTDKTATFTVIFGLTTYWCAYGSNPMVIQRCMSVPTARDAKITCYLLMVGTMFSKLFTSFLGLIIFARYAGCDPLKSGQIEKIDQILPYYIMDVASKLPGLPGIFIAGIFCAALSTMSTGLNTMAGTIYEDLIKCHMPRTTTDKRASDIMKMIVVLLGTICMCLTFFVQHLGAILQLFYSISCTVNGPVMAMFTLGMILPMINETGILYGSIVGVSVMAWIVGGNQYYTYSGQIQTIPLPQLTDNCTTFLNTTLDFHIPRVETTPAADPPFLIYRISFYYFALTGFLITALVAIPISWYTNKNGKRKFVEKKLLSPIVHKIFAKNYEDKHENMKELEKLNRNCSS